MKIAGRKNDGAWFRTNKVIHSLGNDESAALKALMDADEDITGMFEVINDLRTAAGGDTGALPGIAADAGEWTTTLATNGIPRQVWFGQLSYDTYTRSGAPGSYEYAPDHQFIMFKGGKAIRKLMKEFVFARRTLLDLSNVASREAGNPSGIADAQVDLEE